MSMRRCEISQQLRFLSEDQIVAALSGRKCIRFYAYILHNQDRYTVEDEKKNPSHKAGALKEPHWHIIIVFLEGQQQQLEYIAAWFGVGPERVQKIKSRRIEDALAYLIHKNASDKFQYDPSEVKANFDFMNFIKDNVLFLDRGKEIVAAIDNGSITRQNYPEFVNVHEYVKYHKQIEKAFFYAEKKQKKINRQIDVIFITGESGTGKTTLAKYIAEQKGLSCFISSVGQDMLDGYEDEGAIVFNDIRGNCGLSLNELVQLTDNNTCARGKARYHDKNMDKCELIIITTTLSLEQLLLQIDPRHEEDWVQVYRRFRLKMIVYRDHVVVSQYDPATTGYTNPIILDNPVKDLIQKTMEAKPLSADEISAFLKIPMLPATKPQDDVPF